MSRIQKKSNKNLPRDPLVRIFKNQESNWSKFQKKGNKILPKDPWVRIFRNQDSKFSRLQKKGKFLPRNPEDRRKYVEQDPEEGK